jgi:hypothetical protein
MTGSPQMLYVKGLLSKNNGKKLKEINQERSLLSNTQFFNGHHIVNKEIVR